MNPKIILDFQHIGNSRAVVSVDQWKYLGTDDQGNQTNPNSTFGHALTHQPPFIIRLGIEVEF